MLISKLFNSSAWLWASESIHKWVKNCLYHHREWNSNVGMSMRTTISITNAHTGRPASDWRQNEDSDACESTITSDNREVFIALSSLIRAGRHEMALAILDNELGGGCWCLQRKASLNQKLLLNDWIYVTTMFVQPGLGMVDRRWADDYE